MADDNIFDYNIGTTSSSTDVYGTLPPLDSDDWDVAMQSEQPSSSLSELDPFFVPPGPAIDMAAASLLPSSANGGPAIDMAAAALFPSSANGGPAIDMAAAALLPSSANGGPAIDMAAITKAYTRTSEDSEDEEVGFDFTTKKVKRRYGVHADFGKHVHDVMDIGHRVAVRELQDNSAISSDVGGEDQHYYQDGNDRLSLFDLALRPIDKTYKEDRNNIWNQAMWDLCRKKQYIMKWVGMGVDENGCTIWLYEKQNPENCKKGGNADFGKHVHDVMDIGHRVAVRELQDNSAISSDVGGEDQHYYQDGNDRLSLFDLALRPWDKKTNAAKWTLAEQQTKNIWHNVMTDACRKKQYIMKWVGMGVDENGCTIWLYEKQEKKTRKRAVEAVEFEEQSDEELMEMLTEANRPGNWNRQKHSKLATLLAKRAVIAAAKDGDFQQMSETTGGVTRDQVLEWMNDSETFNGYEQIMRGKWSSNFDLKMNTFLKDAGYKRISGGGNGISGEPLRFALPEDIEKQEKKTRKRAVEAVEFEEQSDEELMEMLTEANRPGNWNRQKHSKLATLLAKRAVIAAAKDGDFQQMSETTGGVTRDQVLEWMNDSETFNGYEQIMRGKWSSNFDLKMYTALKDAGYKRIFGGGKSGETLRYAVPRPTDGQNNCLSSEYESEKDKSERQFPKKKKQKTQEQSSKNSKKKKAKKVPKAEEEEQAKKGKQHAKMKAEVEERISEAAAVTQQTTSAVTQHAAV